MPRISMWKPQKTFDYMFMDRNIREWFFVGGTAVYIHKYIGPYQNKTSDDASIPNYTAGSATNPSGIPNETHIQDLLLLENRDRKYDNDVYEMRGVYNVQDNNFDLSQFGILLSSDTLYMTFHINEMVEILGRKLISGDVLELPHLLDNLGLDVNSPAIPKFYVVQDANRGSEGFSQTWYPHIWRVKIGPITDSQEFAGILGDSGEAGINDAVSMYNKTLDITNAVVKSAKDNAEFYDLSLLNVLYNTNDGVPDGYGTGIPTGTTFPDNPNQGDYFIRTDFQPNRLFVRTGTRWNRIVDQVDANTWEAKVYNGGPFIDNTDETVGIGDREFAVRQSISNPIPPKDVAQKE